MPLLFQAPPAFFESAFVPPVCLVYGTRDDVVFRPVNLKHAALYEMPEVTLPMSPRALRLTNPWRDFLLVLMAVLCWLALDRLLIALYPASGNYGFVLGGIMLMLVFVGLVAVPKLRLPSPRPSYRWVHGGAAQPDVLIEFPDSWQEVHAEFVAALRAWLQNPDRPVAPLPPRDFDAEAPPEDDLLDTQSGEWDEGRKSQP